MPRKRTSAASTAIEIAPGRTSPVDTVAAYQMKITIASTSPPIWRRIRVADCTLDLLHFHIQSAFGWENCHLHQFEIGKRCYGVPNPDFGFAIEDERKIRLCNIAPPGTAKVRFKYEYDFGDGWIHNIAVEKIAALPSSEATPVCLAGARACPPEDCGGPWGYVELLRALADQNHPEHEDRMEWSGPIDSEAFDVDATTRAMK